MWIRIARDPYGKPVHRAVSLGSHGVIFGGLAAEVPDDFLDHPEVDSRMFEEVDEDDVNDQDRLLVKNIGARNRKFAEEARINAAIRRETVRRARAGLGLPEEES